jgi:hypothetical protein
MADSAHRGDDSPVKKANFITLSKNEEAVGYLAKNTVALSFFSPSVCAPRGKHTKMMNKRYRAEGWPSDQPFLLLLNNPLFL